MKKDVERRPRMLEKRSSLRARGFWAALSVMLVVVSLAACRKKEVPSESAPGSEAKASPSTPRDETVPKAGPVLPAQVTLKIGSPGGLRNPRGIGLDGAGNVYVVDTGNFRVVKFDPSGKELLSFGQKGSDPGQFVQPWVLAVSAQGNILVLDSETTWIQVFSPAGKFLNRIAGPDLTLYHPSGLAVAPDGTVMVVDTGGNRIVPIKPDGNPLPPLTAAGKEHFSQPTDLSIDARGGLHVYQTAAAKTPSVLYHFTPAGELSATWLAPEAPSTRDTPRTAFSPDGRLYVTDPQNQQVRLYDAGGKAYHLLQLDGPDAPTFRGLTGIAVDTQGRLYVVDGGASVVYRLKVSTAAAS